MPYFGPAHGFMYMYVCLFLFYVLMSPLQVPCAVDWLQFLKQFFINVPYHIPVASLTLMALFQNRAIRVRLALSI